MIDGGKGQLSSAIKELEEFRKEGVPVVSLAKREEEIFVPGKKHPVVLDHDDPGLKIMQRIRDEAHRFAITFHRERRDKADDRVGLRRTAGSRPGAQAAAARALRLARRRW